eukprot:13872519-Heterocapsa_arctica.AAC.1
MDGGLAALVRLPGLVADLRGVAYRVDVAEVLGDVPVGQRPDEHSSGFLPLHGCARDQGSIEVHRLPREGGGRGSSRGVPANILDHGGGLGAPQ